MLSVVAHWFLMTTGAFQGVDLIQHKTDSSCNHDHFVSVIDAV